MRLLKIFITAFIIMTSMILSTAYAQEPNLGLQKATFAGGCFWCMQPFFDHLKGVKETVVGYTGGRMANPGYEDVSTGETGHAESIEVIFNPKEVSYEEVLNLYWHNIDPTQVNGQFVDEGAQYRTVIFYHNEEQKQIAESSK